MNQQQVHEASVARAQKCVELRQRGHTMKEIAAQVGVVKSRVGYYLRQAGLTKQGSNRHTRPAALKTHEGEDLPGIARMRQILYGEKLYDDHMEES